MSVRAAAFVHTGVPQGAAAWTCCKRRLFNRPCQVLEQKLGYENYTAPVSDCRLRLPAPIAGSEQLLVNVHAAAAAPLPMETWLQHPQPSAVLTTTLHIRECRPALQAAVEGAAAVTGRADRWSGLPRELRLAC